MSDKNMDPAVEDGGMSAADSVSENSNPVQKTKSVNTLILFSVAAALGLGGLYMAYQSKQAVDQLQKRLVSMEDRLETAERHASQARRYASRFDEKSIKALALQAFNEERMNRYKAEARKLEADYKLAQPKLDGQDRIYGPAKALITITEFSDYECPFCKRYHPVLKELVDGLAESISPKLVNWKFRHFPLSFHDPAASKGSMFTECVGTVAGNRAFWIASDRLFALTPGNGKGVDDQTLEDIALMAGVKDFDALHRCMRENNSVRAKIESDKAAGRALSINGTPAVMMVNNQTGARVMVNGLASVQELVAAIKQVLPGKQQQAAKAQSSHK